MRSPWKTRAKMSAQAKAMRRLTGVTHVQPLGKSQERKWREQYHPVPEARLMGLEVGFVHHMEHGFIACGWTMAFLHPSTAQLPAIIEKCMFKQQEKV